MAARSVKVTIHNSTDVQFIVSGGALTGGIWSPNQSPFSGDLVLETDRYVFASESDGFLTGTGGSITLSTANLPVANPWLLTFEWDKPFVGETTYGLTGVPPGIDAWFQETVTGTDAEVEVTIVPSMQVSTSFLPSTHGWHFSNTTWPNVANKKIVLPFGLTLPVGNASDGMCGGMTYSAIDYFLANKPIPTRATAPADLSDPDFAYISDRLYDSFHLGDIFDKSALNKYLGYMAADGPTRANATIREALPVIRGNIAMGVPAALGLIGANATGVVDGVASLGKNHQVAAYWYHRDGSIVTLGIYDSNIPDDDGLQIKINADVLVNPSLTHNISTNPLFMFFETGYEFVTPP
ncbi:hypothetical protein [Rhodococcus koreensis]